MGAITSTSTPISAPSPRGFAQLTDGLCLQFKPTKSAWPSHSGSSPPPPRPLFVLSEALLPLASSGVTSLSLCFLSKPACLLNEFFAPQISFPLSPSPLSPPRAVFAVSLSPFMVVPATRVSLSRGSVVPGSRQVECRKSPECAWLNCPQHCFLHFNLAYVFER